jgi:putative phosphoesterase
MRIGIFSDIHANLEALQAVLKFLTEQKVEQYLIIGDIIGYGANPNECIEVVKDLNGILVAGNHDYGVLGKTDIKEFNDTAKEAIVWTKKVLNRKSIKFLESLPLENNYLNFLLVHASPLRPDDWNYVITLKQAENQFKYFQEQICFIGHSHCPIIIEKNLSKNETKIINDKKFKIKERGFRYLINAGSVGQPRDGNPHSCVMIYNTITKQMEIKRLEYDIKTAQAKIIAAGLPSILAYRLSKGQ